MKPMIGVHLLSAIARERYIINVERHFFSKMYRFTLNHPLPCFAKHVDGLRAFDKVNWGNIHGIDCSPPGTSFHGILCCCVDNPKCWSAPLQYDVISYMDNDRYECQCYGSLWCLCDFPGCSINSKFCMSLYSMCKCENELSVNDTKGFDYYNITYCCSYQCKLRGTDHPTVDALIDACDKSVVVCFSTKCNKYFVLCFHSDLYK